MRNPSPERIMELETTEEILHDVSQILQGNKMLSVPAAAERVKADADRWNRMRHLVHDCARLAQEHKPRGIPYLLVKVGGEVDGWVAISVYDPHTDRFYDAPTLTEALSLVPERSTGPLV